MNEQRTMLQTMREKYLDLTPNEIEKPFIVVENFFFEYEFEEIISVVNEMFMTRHLAGGWAHQHARVASDFTRELTRLVDAMSLMNKQDNTTRQSILPEEQFLVYQEKFGQLDRNAFAILPRYILAWEDFMNPWNIVAEFFRYIKPADFSLQIDNIKQHAIGGYSFIDIEDVHNVPYLKERLQKFLNACYLIVIREKKRH